jgi:hypothetical protein
VEYADDADIDGRRQGPISGIHREMTLIELHLSRRDRVH